MWRALRIDYHETDFGRILIEAVAPFLDDLRGDCPVASLLRPHWLGGPHLTIAFRTDAATFRHNLYPRCRNAIDSWLTQNLSETRIDPADYFAKSQVWAATEHETGSLLPLRPNNRVAPARYLRPLPMALDALASIRDEFLSKTTDIQLNSCALRRADRRCFFARLLTMLTLIARVRPGEDYAFWPLSFEAHAEIFKLNHPGADRRFADLKLRLADVVSSAFEHLLNSTEDTAYDSLEYRWLAAMRRADAAIQEVIDNNYAHIRKQIHDVDFGVRSDDDPTPRVNPFGIDPANMIAFLAPTHIAYRLLINFVYLALPVMGVTPSERAAAAYLIADHCKLAHPTLRLRAQSRMKELLIEAREIIV